MKILFLSDIHGVPSTLERALKMAETLNPDRIALLGDLLYHGPRNGVPNFYDPVRVMDILNGLKDRIVAVRGNCDAEVDQMMFQFPMMADYAVLDAGSETFFLTHGHLFNENRLPPTATRTSLATVSVRVSAWPTRSTRSSSTSTTRRRACRSSNPSSSASAWKATRSARTSS